VDLAQQRIGQLAQALGQVSTNPAQYGLGAGEVQRRKQELQSLQAAAQDVRDSVEGSGGRRSRHNERKSRRSGFETEQTAGMTLDELHTQQVVQMEQQDSQIDMISDGVNKLKIMSGDMSHELDIHANLLDGLSEHVDDTDARIVSNTTRIDDIRERASGCFAMCCMLLLIVIIVLLLATDWFRKILYVVACCCCCCCCFCFLLLLRSHSHRLTSNTHAHTHAHTHRPKTKSK
jgi:hypothetical protein